MLKMVKVADAHSLLHQFVYLSECGKYLVRLFGKCDRMNY